jgi:Uma2 family endonuclease
MPIVTKHRPLPDRTFDSPSATAIVLSGCGVEIPLPMNSLADFRRWAVSEGFPDKGRIDYVGGVIEIDMQAETVYSHGGPKAEIARVIGNRVKSADLGEYYFDAMRCSCLPADLSAEPDVVVLLHESFESGRIELTPKASDPDDYVEIDGPPDLVVEVVSDDSVGKDTKRLFAAYFLAGVREYWLVDARRSELSFQLLTRGDLSFANVLPDEEGFRGSVVLGRRYRLDRRAGRRGQPEYDLRERE